jgi:alpha-L-rhamnosidase
MFGDISAWMYQYLAGITPDPENPGFKHIIIHPRPVTGLDWVNVEYDSPFGKIQVIWEKHQEKFKMDVKIPDLTTATIKLPDSGVKHVGAGEYRFDAKINTMCKKSY